MDALEPRCLFAGDLAITQLSITPFSDIAPGEPLMGPITVVTPPDLMHGAAKLKVYLSADATLSGEDTLLWTHESTVGPYPFPPLLSLRLPQTVAPGKYHVIAAVDPDNVIAEPDETNNVLASNQINVLPPTDDFSISSISVTSSSPIFPGAAVTVAGVFSSTGPGANVSFYLSADNVAGNADDILLPSYVRVDALNQSKSATAYVPRSTPLGTYRLVAKIDAYGEHAETDETNNVALGPAVTVFATPDLPDFVAQSYATPEALADVEVGTPISGLGQIANVGAARSSVPSKLFLSADQTLSADDVLVSSFDANFYGNPVAGTWGAGTWPVLPDGTYYPILVADPDNLIAEIVETNNVVVGNPVTLHNPVTPPVGFVPVVNEVYGEGGGGYTVTAGARINLVASLDNFPDFYHIPVNFYLSTDQIVGNDDDLPIASADATRAIWRGYTHAQYTLPADLSPGTYYVIAVPQGGTGAVSVNPLNVVTQSADVVITSVSTPSAATPGSNVYVDLSFTVHSPAPSDYRGLFHVAYYLSADDVFGNEDDILLPGPVYNQNPHFTGFPFQLDHAHFDQSDSFTIPDSVPAGAYHLFAVADSQRVVAEADESNNVFSAGTFTVVDSELEYALTLATASHAASPRAVTPGSPARATLKLSNPGTRDIARKYGVRFFLSDDATFSPDDKLFSRQTIRAAVSAGKSATLPLTYTLPRGARLGTRYLIVVADPVRARPSTTRAVSVAAARIQTATKIIVTAPRLTAAVLSTRTNGDSTRLKLRITNTGNARFQSTATVRVLSEATGDLVGSVTKPVSLNAGQSRTLLLAVPTTDPLRVDLA